MSTLQDPQESPQRRSPSPSPFERISVDHISPLPISDGFDAILVVVDFFTKYKIFIPCNTTDSSPDFVQHYITHVFPHFGLPGSIVSDQGTTFVSKFTKALWKQLSVKPLPSTAYHPQTNGQTERANQELEQYLRFYCNYEQDNWSSLLPLAQFVFNSRFHSGIQNNALFPDVWFLPPDGPPSNPTGQSLPQNKRWPPWTLRALTLLKLSPKLHQ